MLYNHWTARGPIVSNCCYATMDPRDVHLFLFRPFRSVNCCYVTMNTGDIPWFLYRPFRLENWCYLIIKPVDVLLFLYRPFCIGNCCYPTMDPGDVHLYIFRYTQLWPASAIYPSNIGDIQYLCAEAYFRWANIVEILKDPI